MAASVRVSRVRFTAGPTSPTVRVSRARFFASSVTVPANPPVVRVARVRFFTGTPAPTSPAVARVAAAKFFTGKSPSPNFYLYRIGTGGALTPIALADVTSAGPVVLSALPPLV